MEPIFAGSKPAISPEVNIEFKANLEQKQNNNVEKVGQLLIDGEMHSVKLTETSPQAEAVGQGRKSKTTFFKNLLDDLRRVLKSLFCGAQPKTTQPSSEQIHTISSQTNELKESGISHLELKQEPLNALRVREIAARYEADNDLGIGGGRSAKDDSKKTALDAVSFLSTPSGIKVKPDMMIGNLELMLGSKEINKLQDALSNGDISFTMIKNSVSSKGDLSMVRELALSTVSKQEAKYAGSIGEMVNSLSHTRPNIGAVMQGLKGFIDTSAQKWHEKTREKPEDSLDANAHARFDEALMNSALNDMSTSDLKDTLTHLEGPFGERMRSVLGFVAGQVPMSDLAQDDRVLISTSMRFSGVIEGLITAIREKLGENTDVPFKDGERINSLEQLKPLEKAALLRVGISEEMLV